MKIIDSSEFEKVTASGVVLVDFFATWCGPCKMLGPVLEALAEEYAEKMEIVKVDVDQSSDLAAKYNIMSVPTMLIFKNGQPIKQIMGYQPKELLENSIKQVL